MNKNNRYKYGQIIEYNNITERERVLISRLVKAGDFNFNVIMQLPEKIIEEVIAISLACEVDQNSANFQPEEISKLAKEIADVLKVDPALADEIEAHGIRYLYERLHNHREKIKKSDRPLPGDDELQKQ